MESACCSICVIGWWQQAVYNEHITTHHRSTKYFNLLYDCLRRCFSLSSHSLCFGMVWERNLWGLGVLLVIFWKSMGGCFVCFIIFLVDFIVFCMLSTFILTTNQHWVLVATAAVTAVAHTFRFQCSLRISLNRGHFPLLPPFYGAAALLPLPGITDLHLVFTTR